MIETTNTCLVVIDLQEKLVPALDGKTYLLNRSEAFIKGMKLLEVPILITQQYTKGLGATFPQIAEVLKGFEPIEKTAFSCMAEPAFCARLNELRIRNIVVIGAEAHICVQQTVLEMLLASYSVYVAADCIASRKLIDLQHAMERMRASGATVTTLESILFELLRTAEHPCRKQIQALIMNL